MYIKPFYTAKFIDKIQNINERQIDYQQFYYHIGDNSMNENIKVLLFCKKTIFCEYAKSILFSHFDKNNCLIAEGSVGEKLNQDLEKVHPEYIISFLSPWILTKKMIESATKAAINFHPGSVKYPGTGCYNFALYEQSKEYGVVGHYMKEKVDTGDIIISSNFKIAENETIETLKLKSMLHLLSIYEIIISYIRNGISLPISDEKWERAPFTRKQLNDLCVIDSKNQSSKEINLRIRATDYPSINNQYGAYTVIDGLKFYYPSESREPIA